MGNGFSGDGPPAIFARVLDGDAMTASVADVVVICVKSPEWVDAMSRMEMNKE